MNSRDNFSLQLGDNPMRDRAIDRGPFHVVIFADVGARTRAPLAERKSYSIDPDTLNDVMKALEIQVATSSGTFAIASMDDLHPERLAKLMPKRKSVMASAIPENEPPPPRTGRSVLAEMLGEPLPNNVLEMRPRNELRAYVARSVEESSEQRPSAAEKRAAADERSRQSDDLSAVLHNTEWKRQEAFWRALDMFTRRVELNGQLRVSFMPATLSELTSSAAALAQNLSRMEAPPSVLAGAFDLEEADLPLLPALAKIAAHVQAPWLLAAGTSLLGSPDWAEFRQTEAAEWFGVSVPGVLTRLPYGLAHDPVDAMDYEEFDRKPEPLDLPFANPALLTAMLLAKSFEEQGWSMRPGTVREIDDVPLPLYRDEDGDPVAVPPVEIDLDEATAEKLLDSGFMPFVWPRNTDTLRVIRFQSAADPVAPLPGRWS